MVCVRKSWCDVRVANGRRVLENPMSTYFKSDIGIRTCSSD